MSVKNKNIGDFYPLSPMQQGILFHSLTAPLSDTYFEQFSWNFQGKLNVKAFNRVWQYLIERHSILRTSFVWEGLKEPVQIVHRQVNLPWCEYNWQHLSPEEQQHKLQAFLQSDRSIGFELKQPPLMRFTLIQLSEVCYNFTWSHHHLLLDGWSASLVFKEFLACYKAFSNGREVYLEPIRPYRDYIVWLQQQNLSRAETFWRHTLKGFTTPTQLSVNKGASFLTQTDSYQEEELKLSVVTTTTLQSVTKQHQLTLNTIVQGAWALLLSRYSGQEDVVFGAVTSGRPPTLAKAESIVGLLINTVPIRVQLSPEEFLVPWLHKIKDRLVEAGEYEYCPLVKVQGWSEIPKGFSLFESIVVFENYAVDASVRHRDINLQVEDFHSFEKTNYPITLTVIPDRELSFKIATNDSERFDSDTITRMLGHLQTLLEAIVANPQQRLTELPLLTASEQHQLLVDWNDTQVDYSQYQCIHELFEAQVEKTPNAVAVVFENQQLTYRELNAKANQLADYLRSQGVKPEVLVGICVERSLEMVIGLLGILKAGGAYIPLDPSYPQERLTLMLEDSQIPILLSQQHLVEKFPTHKAKVICLDSDWDKIANQNSENLTCNVNSHNLAYVIYTSGSTGKPKGAMNTHQGACNRLLWMQDTYKLTTADRVLQKTPFSFDVSVWEFFWTLMTGACLIIAKPEGHRDSNYLVKLIKEQQITTSHFVPSMLQIFLDEQEIEDCQQLKRVFCSGEALSFELQSKLFARCQNVELHNLYGPTEAAIDVTFWHCQPHSEEKIVPIGRPIANTQIYILDRQLQPVPVGVPGELHIGGVGLARGYLNRPELTNEKFIANPFSNKPEEKLYKTGDLARYLPNRAIEYLGRIDNQVKIRGFRIELGEIESVLQEIPEIKQAVVIVRDESNNQQIVAYIVPDYNSPEPQFEYLREFLQQKLPDYMIPSAFVVLNSLPLTPNGKLDRRALPAPEITLKPNHQNVLPRTAIEEKVAEIWAELLGLTKISIHENFFEVGGHSLLATQVMSKIRQTWQIELSLTRLFEIPTIALLSAEITKSLEEQEEKSIIAPQRLPRKARRVKLSSLNTETKTNN